MGETLKLLFVARISTSGYPLAFTDGPFLAEDTVVEVARMRGAAHSPVRVEIPITSMEVFDADEVKAVLR
jgi:hypothetical protein